MLQRIFSVFSLIICLSFRSLFAQVGEFYKMDVGGVIQDFPFFYKYPGDRILLTNRNASQASMSLLNEDMSVVWTRSFSLGTSSLLQRPRVLPNGEIQTLFDVSLGSESYRRIGLRLNASGELLTARELINTAENTQFFGYFYYRGTDGGEWHGGSSRLRLGANNYGGLAVVRTNAAGEVIFAKRPLFKNQFLTHYTSMIKSGVTDTLILAGNIQGAEAAYMMKMVDTTVVQFRVYHLGGRSGNDGNTSGINHLKTFPNGDFLAVSFATSSFMHIMRLSPNGNIIWHRAIKNPGIWPREIVIKPNEEIWISGNVPGGIAACLMAKLRPNGDLIDVKTMFSLGGLNIAAATGLVQMSNQQMLVGSSFRGSLTSAGDLLLHTLNDSIIYKCFRWSHSAQYADTNLAVVDSTSSMLTWLPQTYSVNSLNIADLTVINTAATTAIVDCAVPVKEELAKEQVSVYPNPATSEVHIKGLPPGTRVQLFRLDGKWLGNSNTDKPINLRNFASGLLFLHHQESGRHWQVLHE